ncbi:MAG: hypothetical protein ACYCW6_09185 [Candidatus Xenobia bacterium]
MRVQFRICATCRHLEVVEQGREFAAIADTEYTVFRCGKLGWTTREDYLMAPPSDNLPSSEAFDCPHWEEYPSEQVR